MIRRAQDTDQVRWEPPSHYPRSYHRYPTRSHHRRDGFHFGWELASNRPNNHKGSRRQGGNFRPLVLRHDFTSTRLRGPSLQSTKQGGNFHVHVHLTHEAHRPRTGSLRESPRAMQMRLAFHPQGRRVPGRPLRFGDDYAVMRPRPPVSRTCKSASAAAPPAATSTSAPAPSPSSPTSGPTAPPSSAPPVSSPRTSRERA